MAKSKKVQKSGLMGGGAHGRAGTRLSGENTVQVENGCVHEKKQLSLCTPCGTETSSIMMAFYKVQDTCERV